MTVRNANPMVNKGVKRGLGATDSSPRPGSFSLGSAQSRAAARAMLVRRKAIEDAGLCFVAVSIVDGSRVNLYDFAEPLQAARNRAIGFPDAPPATGEGNGGWRAECFAERIRQARERVARAQDPETML